MSVTFSNISEIYGYTNIEKLLVFRYLSNVGNAAFGDYNGSMQLGANDVDKFEMSVSNVTIQNESENSAKQYVIHDANSDCVYLVAFFEIPLSYQMGIMTISGKSTFVIYQKYLE
jgi:hypothetical protein